MAIRDQIVGFLMTSNAKAPNSSRQPFLVSSGDDLMVGALSNLVLPAKAFRRSVQIDPVGVQRRAATLGLNEMRLTGQLRIWSPDIISMFGTSRYGEETRSIAATEGGDVADSGNEESSWIIRMVVEGYHLSSPRSAYLSFGGVWDEFPEVTLAPDQEETPVPFGVDLHHYTEWYSDEEDITKQEFSQSYMTFDYDADGLGLWVRRDWSAPKVAGRDHTGMTNMWEHRKVVYGIA